MHNSPTATGDSFTSREEAILGHHRKRGLLKYKSLEAGFCRACETVYGVECPRCKALSGLHGFSEEMFTVRRPLETTREEGHNWTLTTCRKCDFQFRVIVQ